MIDNNTVQSAGEEKRWTPVRRQKTAYGKVMAKDIASEGRGL